MRSRLEDNTLTLYLEGRLGIDESQTVQDELMDAIAANPDADVVIDAGDLEYISSSGLRVLALLSTVDERLATKPAIGQRYLCTVNKNRP